jgi:hypothetical protein
MATLVVTDIRWEFRQEQLPDTASITVDLELFPLSWRENDGSIRRDMLEPWIWDELEDFYLDICRGFEFTVEYA